MTDLNITFEPQPATANGPSLAVRCDQLPVRHQCRIDEQPRLGSPTVWFLCTATSNPYASRRRRVTRKHREFKSLDAAKAAAVAYVKARVAEAKRREPVRHGHGQYQQGERGGWYVSFDSGPGWQPAGSKKAAIALLDNPPVWAFADCKS